MMLKKVDRDILCGVCNDGSMILGVHNKVCLSCYFKHDRKIPKYIPFEQHDLWIIKYHKKGQKGKAI